MILLDQGHVRATVRRRAGTEPGATASRGCLSSCLVKTAVDRSHLKHPAWSAATRGGPLAAGLLAGAAAAALLGDPRRGHPVALFGRAAQAVQARVYADRRLAGVGYTASCVTLALGPALLAD